MAIDSQVERWSVLHLGRACRGPLPGSGIGRGDRQMMMGLYAFGAGSTSLLNVEISAAAILGLALSAGTLHGLALSAEPTE